MKIGSEFEYIEMIELERGSSELPNAGDVKIDVSVKFQEFQGRYSSVWIELTELQNFHNQLNKLEKSRQGSASIKSMNPDEFIIEIRSSDKLGHMEIEISLKRYQYSGQTAWPIKLSGGFETDPQSIKELLSCINQFIS
jgi:hypothetical protein